MGHGSKVRRWVSLVAAGAVAVSVGVVQAVPSGAGATLPPGVTKIQHVVVLMQENRSYDSYYARLHYEGQPASSVEPLGGNPNPNAIGVLVSLLLVPTASPGFTRRSPTAGALKRSTAQRNTRSRWSSSSWVNTWLIARIASSSAPMLGP